MAPCGHWSTRKPTYYISHLLLVKITLNRSKNKSCIALFFSPPSNISVMGFSRHRSTDSYFPRFPGLRSVMDVLKMRSAFIYGNFTFYRLLHRFEILNKPSNVKIQNTVPNYSLEPALESHCDQPPTKKNLNWLKNSVFLSLEHIHNSLGKGL